MIDIVVGSTGKRVNFHQIFEVTDLSGDPFFRVALRLKCLHDRFSVQIHDDPVFTNPALEDLFDLFGALPQLCLAEKMD